MPLIVSLLCFLSVSLLTSNWDILHYASSKIGIRFSSGFNVDSEILYAEHFNS